MSVDALMRRDACLYLTSNAKEMATKKKETANRIRDVTSTICDFDVT
jgi:hypothetical protein